MTNPAVVKIGGRWVWTRDIEKGEEVEIPAACYRDLVIELFERLAKKEQSGPADNPVKAGT